MTQCGKGDFKYKAETRRDRGDARGIGGDGGRTRDETGIDRVGVMDAHRSAGGCFGKNGQLSVRIAGCIRPERDVTYLPEGIASRRETRWVVGSRHRSVRRDSGVTAGTLRP